MKKNIFVIVMVGVLLLLVGCGSSKAEESSVKGLSKEERYDWELARKADSQQEVFEILEKRNNKSFQMALAKSGSAVVQETLLNYDNLDDEVLVEICKNPCIQIGYYQNRDSIVSAIKAADLTVEQEIALIKTEKYPMQLGVLLREALSAEALIYLLESNKGMYTLSLEQYQHKEYIAQQIINHDFSLEQKEKLRSLDINVVNEALLLKETLQ